MTFKSALRRNEADRPRSSNTLYPPDEDDDEEEEEDDGKHKNAWAFTCRTCTANNPNKPSQTLQPNNDPPRANTTNSTLLDLTRSASSLSLEDSVLEDGPWGVDIVPEMCTLCGQEIRCPVCGEPTDQGVVLETEEQPGATTSKGKEGEMEGRKGQFSRGEGG